MPKVTQQSWDWIWASPTVGQSQLEAPGLALQPPEALPRLYSGSGASQASCPGSRHRPRAQTPGTDAPPPWATPGLRVGLVGWSVIYTVMLVNPHCSI